MRIEIEDMDKKIAYLQALADGALNALKAYRKELIDYHGYCGSSANRSKFQRLRKELAKEMIVTEKYIYSGENDDRA